MNIYEGSVHMRYILIVIVLLLFSGCGTMIAKEKNEGKKLIEESYVEVNREDATDMQLSDMKRDDNVKISLELLGKITETNNELVIETDYGYAPLPDNYKDLVALDDDLRIIYYDAEVSSYNSDTVKFTYNDMVLYKVISSDVLLEQFDCTECKTYYIVYAPKGEGTIDDYEFNQATGYYVESMGFSFLADSLFSYDYVKGDYLSSDWYSNKEDDELINTRRYTEIDHSNIGIYDYIERFNDYWILY